MSKMIVGIDVSKDTLDVAILKDKEPFRQFANTSAGFNRLQNWLMKNGADNVHACLEATGKYAVGVAEYLYQDGHQVSMVNPYRIHRYRESRLVRNKTDKIDAFILARFCEEQKPDLWQPPAPIYQELKHLSRHLDSLMGMKQQEVNRRKSGASSQFVIELIDQHIVLLDQQIQSVKDQMDRLISQDRKLSTQQRLLVSITGIGTLTANRLIAEVQEFSRFESGDHLAAYAGLTPRIYSSGTSVHRKESISKMGNVHIRKLLYMPAIVAKNNNPIFKSFSDRLVENGKCNMLIVIAVMRKLLVLCYAILRDGIPFDPNFQSSPI